MDIFNILSLIGGFALFLFGMSLMGSALEKRAGNRLKSILADLTSNKFKGFLLGLGITAIIQSSSATTVMVVGFVNSGIMELSQSIGIVMGANLGTSVTSWLLSLTGIEGDALFIKLLKPEAFTPVLAFIGIIMYMFVKSSKKKDTGLILIGFAVLMFGMEMMSDSVSPLSENEAFKSVLVAFSNPFLGVLVGTVFTAVIQSSSASVGILQALTMTGSVSYATAIPIIMGQNIGTCVSAMISSIGATKNAKRVAIIHLSFNLIATLILLPGYYIADAVFQFAFADKFANPLSIAIVHTVFKILALALLMPFTKQLEKLSRFIVKDKKGDDRTELLDERLLHTPTVAIERCKDVAAIMAELAVKSFKRAGHLLEAYSEKEAEAIRSDEGAVDHYEDALGSYLVKLSSQSMSEADSAEVAKLLHIIGDFERISDHAVNIVESAEEINDKKITLSPNAERELGIMISAVSEVLDLAINAFEHNDLESAVMIEALEEVVDYLRDTLKRHHIARLQKNECTIEMGFVLSDLLINYERASDHCSNIAGYVLEMGHEDSYNQSVAWEDNEEFKNNYAHYRMKYSLS